ncbi:MAG: immunoglobulin domain-containing protein [Planctomycetes bacterium]|nr:immunoglobulin domain-containing protein [Planctomycetota bacterium]MBI3847252.1 immunoglobulin domain-containing protein [Planctomycetota bacterium]
MSKLSLCTGALIAGLFAIPAFGQVTINEIRVDQPGADNDEYFELAGPPGTALTGLTYIVLGDGGAGNNCGVIETVVNLNAFSIPADGHFLAVESAFTIGGGLASADLNTGTTAANVLNFENTDNVTHMLVSGFTGALAQDLDTNEDGVLDSTPWTAIIDSVALRAVTAGGDCVYSTAVVGPVAGQTENPAHAFRCPDGTGAWTAGRTSTATGNDTPGVTNDGAANTVPVISTQPTNQTTCDGGSVTFTVVATNGTLTYQWRKGGVDIGGATSASFTINPAGLGDAGNYDVVVSNGCGTTTSNTVTLTVGGSTQITTQPMGSTVFVGDPASFSVVGSGTPPITYQWRKGGVDIGGETNSTYTIPVTTLGDSGTYDVVVTSGCGAVTSDPAVLVVRTVPAITINEIRVDQTGTDNDEYFELTGPPGESLSGLTYVVIGDTSTPADSCGRIEAIVSLNGLSIPADGYFLAVEDTFTLQPIGNADLVLSSAGNALNFENTDNVTHLLVRGFTGVNAQDVDTNDDGVLDSPPWTGVLDSVAIVLGSSPPNDCTYSTTMVGPKGAFTPGHVYRCPNATGAWVIGIFDPAVGRDTPGLANAGPVITTQPMSVSADVGSTVMFGVVADGGVLTYQWRKGGVDISGETNSTLTLSNITGADAGSYDVVVSNGCDSATSNAAILTVTANQPVRLNEIRTVGDSGDVDEYVEICGPASQSLNGLSVVVIGGDGAGNTGTIDAVIDLASTSVPANGHFLAADSNFALACGRTPDLTITTPLLENSANLSFFLVAGFTGTVGQDLDANDDCMLDSTPWFASLDDVSIVGSSAVPPADCPYSATVVGPDGSNQPIHIYRCPDHTGAWSIDATGTPNCRAIETPGFGNPPCILTHPVGQSVCEGQSASFSVTAIGNGTVTYQWNLNGNAIGGANASMYSIPLVHVADAGNYTVLVTDDSGSLESNPATLTVGPVYFVRAGNVNGGVGPVTDVLFLNNGVGTGTERRVDIGQNDPFTLRIDAVPAGGRRYAMYVWRNEPGKTDRETLPQGVGEIAFPTPLTGNLPHPLRIANNTGRPALGAENWPGPPTQMAPYTLLNLPTGVRRAGTFYFQGIIFDGQSPSGQAAVTNGILVVSQ